MMPRSGMPCAGVCGKLLSGGGRGSLPPGERTCRECRRKQPRPYGPRSGDPTRRARVVELRRQGLSYRRIAALIGFSYDTVSSDLRLAGVDLPAIRAECATRNRSLHPCQECGAQTDRWGRRCEPCAEAGRRVRWQRKNLKRRADGEPMSIREVAERNGWRCHLCRRKVSAALQWPHPRSASRDHLIPVADGGTNDPANLALAHLSCNVRRGTGGTVQLALVG